MDVCNDDDWEIPRVLLNIDNIKMLCCVVGSVSDASNPWRLDECCLSCQSTNCSTVFDVLTWITVFLVIVHIVILLSQHVIATFNVQLQCSLCSG